MSDGAGKKKNNGRRRGPANKRGISKDFDNAAAEDAAGVGKRWTCVKNCSNSKGDVLIMQPSAKKCTKCGAANCGKMYIPNKAAAAAKPVSPDRTYAEVAGLKDEIKQLRDTIKTMGTPQSPPADSSAKGKEKDEKPKMPELTKEQREHRENLKKEVDEIKATLPTIKGISALDLAYKKAKEDRMEALLFELRQYQPADLRRTGINKGIKNAEAKKRPFRQE